MPIILNGANGIITPSTTSSGDVIISDKIVHLDDTNTAIRFPAADTVTVETDGTERLRIDSSGKIGIGLTPSTSNTLTGVAAGALQVNGNIELRYAGVNTDPDGARYFNIVNTDTTLVADQPLGGIQWVGLDTDNPNSNMTSITSYCDSNAGTTGDLRFKIAGSERMRIAANGNVGIGTTAPAGRLHARFDAGAGDGHTSKYIFQSIDQRLTIGTYWESGVGQYARIQSSSDSPGVVQNLLLNPDGGNVLVGTTSALGLVTFQKTTEATPVIVAKNPQYSLDCWATNSTGNNVFIRFFTEAGGSLRGSITYNRPTAVVAYNTTSDYRSKDIVGKISDASSAVLSLKPYMGKMKGAEMARPMFVAHETQEIAPYIVTGEKDAVDNEGNPIYQQMDHSGLVPLLTAALQEALTEITIMKARIAALESQ